MIRKPYCCFSHSKKVEVRLRFKVQIIKQLHVLAATRSHAVQLDALEATFGHIHCTMQGRVCTMYM